MYIHINSLAVICIARVIERKQITMVDVYYDRLDMVHCGDILRAKVSIPQADQRVVMVTTLIRPLRVSMLLGYSVRITVMYNPRVLPK